MHTRHILSSSQCVPFTYESLSDPEDTNEIRYVHSRELETLHLHLNLKFSNTTRALIFIYDSANITKLSVLTIFFLRYVSVC